MTNRPLLRYGLIGLCLAIPGVPAGLAQQASKPVPGLMRWASLGLRFDRRGGVEVRLQTTVPPARPEIWRQALQTALHAPLEDVREEIFPGGALWMLQAHADAVLEQSTLAAEGTIDLKPLLDLLGAGNVKQLSLYIEHPSAGFSECPAEKGLSDFTRTRYYWDVPVASPPPLIHLAFGYPPDWVWRLWIPVVFPLAAAVLGWWLMRRRRGEDGDRCVAWFRAWRIQRRLIFALWFVWILLVFAVGFVPPAAFYLSGIYSGRYVWMALVLLLPPALAVLFCKVLSAPTFAGVPEVGWTRRRLFLQALWGQLGIVAVGFWMARGLDAGEIDPSSNARLWNFLGALGLALLCLVGWLVVRNAGFAILPPGDARQRLFELAEQIQVRVHQAHLVPAVPWRLLNALGTLGNCVYLTGEVLPHLSLREVDALLALELVRLWQPRGRIPWRTLASVPLMIVVCGVCGTLVAMIGIQTAWPLFLLPGVLAAVRGSRRARHFVPARDRNALAITGDPEALITALAKLHRLQLLPLVAGEERNAFAGPPEDWPRLQDLADRAGIPPERLHEILDRPGSGEDRYPHEPAAAVAAPEPEDRVFTKAFKQRAFAWHNALRMVVEIGIPSLTAYLVQSQEWHGTWLAGAYLTGLLLLFLIRRRLERFLSGRTAVALGRGLKGKLKPEDFESDARNATLVGLSPHGQPRNYEGFMIWDVGFVMLIGEHLCYVGDRTRFALERSCVRDIYMGPGTPGWRKPKRVYLAWHDDSRGVGGTINLGALESRPFWRRGSNTADLEKRLRQWLHQPAAVDELPPLLRELSGPDFGTVASQSLAKLASFSNLVGLWILRIPIAVVVCFLLGLSFDPDAGAGAWYVLLTVALREAAYVLSFLQYRDKPDDSGDADALAVPAAIDPGTRAR